MSAGKRLLYQPLTGTMKAQRAGVGRAAMGDVTPAGEKVREILREISGRAADAKKAATFSKNESSSQSPIAVPTASAIRRGCQSQSPRTILWD
jgi:hypothetical protein